MESPILFLYYCAISKTFGPSLVRQVTTAGCSTPKVDDNFTASVGHSLLAGSYSRSAVFLGRGDDVKKICSWLQRWNAVKRTKEKKSKQA